VPKREEWSLSAFSSLITSCTRGVKDDDGSIVDRPLQELIWRVSRRVHLATPHDLAIAQPLPELISTEVAKILAETM
jgi:hypothetical protein